MCSSYLEIYLYMYMFVCGWIEKNEKNEKKRIGLGGSVWYDRLLGKLLVKIVVRIEYGFDYMDREGLREVRDVKVVEIEGNYER